jgi:hypothetical protein
VVRGAFRLLLGGPSRCCECRCGILRRGRRGGIELLTISAAEEGGAICEIEKLDVEFVGATGLLK